MSYLLLLLQMKWSLTFECVGQNGHLPVSLSLHCNHTRAHTCRLPPGGGNLQKIWKKAPFSPHDHGSFLLESVHGRAINWGQENLEAGALFSLPVRTRFPRHPSHRPRECLTKLIWISGDQCLGHPPRPLKCLGSVPIFGKESSAYCGFIFK